MLTTVDVGELAEMYWRKNITSWWYYYTIGSELRVNNFHVELRTLNINASIISFKDTVCYTWSGRD